MMNKLIFFLLISGSLWAADPQKDKKVTFQDSPELIIILPEGIKDSIEIEGPTIIHVGGILIKVTAPKIKKDECIVL